MKKSNVVHHYIFLIKKINLEKCYNYKFYRCFRLCKNKNFENFVLFVIILSSIILVIDTY